MTWFVVCNWTKLVGHHFGPPSAQLSACAQRSHPLWHRGCAAKMCVKDLYPTVFFAEPNVWKRQFFCRTKMFGRPQLLEPTLLPAGCSFSLTSATKDQNTSTHCRWMIFCTLDFLDRESERGKNNVAALWTGARFPAWPISLPSPNRRSRRSLTFPIEAVSVETSKRHNWLPKNPDRFFPLTSYLLLVQSKARRGLQFYILKTIQQTNHNKSTTRDCMNLSEYFQMYWGVLVSLYWYQKFLKCKYSNCFHKCVYFSCNEYLSSFCENLQGQKNFLEQIRREKARLYEGKKLYANLVLCEKWTFNPSVSIVHLDTSYPWMEFHCETLLGENSNKSGSMRILGPYLGLL